MPRKVADNSGLFTHDGHPLSTKEAKFIDLHVSGATQTQAYKEAYGEEDSSKASSEARKIIRKPHIIEEIRYRTEKAKNESIATMQEIMEYYTGVMRGDVKDAFGLEASLAERTKCAMELAKRMSILEDRAAGSQPQDNVVTLKLDWGQGSAPVATIKKSESEK